jgi:hypothetical protein
MRHGSGLRETAPGAIGRNADLQALAAGSTRGLHPLFAVARHTAVAPIGGAILLLFGRLLNLSE